MKIFPAIDILNDRVVRLRQGDYNAVTEYGDDPMTIAQEIKADGFSCLHVVDLGGAKIGRPTAQKSVQDIASLGLDLQVGGGIRTPQAAESYLKAGAHRVIVSTQALREPPFFHDLCTAFGPDRVMLSLDLQEGKIGVDGWTQSLHQSLDDILRSLRPYHLIVTDIARDGMLTGIDLDLYADLRRRFPEVCLTAAGGVDALPAVQKLEELGLYAAVIGRAFYERPTFRRELAACLT